MNIWKMQSLEIIVFQLILEANQPHNFLPPPKKKQFRGRIFGFSGNNFESTFEL